MLPELNIPCKNIFEGYLIVTIYFEISHSEMFLMIPMVYPLV